MAILRHFREADVRSPPEAANNEMGTATFFSAVHQPSERWAESNAAASSTDTSFFLLYGVEGLGASLRLTNFSHLFHRRFSFPLPCFFLLAMGALQITFMFLGGFLMAACVLDTWNDNV